MIENVFVKAEFDVPDVLKAYVAGAVAASIGGKQNPMIHYVVASVKSLQKKNIFFAPSDITETLLYKSYIECVSGSNVDTKDARCNTTDM